MGKASADDLCDRHRWRELLELARRRQLDLIVVWRLDRAFRSVLDGATTLGDLRAWGNGLRSLQEPWIDSTTTLGCRERVLLTVDEYGTALEPPERYVVLREHAGLGGAARLGETARLVG